MYRLYWNDNTGAFAIEAALVLAQAPVELVRIDHRRGENRGAEFLALNPQGLIPTLRLPDGEIMTESAAMLLHLADAFPAARLAPPAGDKMRPRFLRWLMICATGLYEAELRAFHAERYTTDPGGAAGVQAAARAMQARLFALAQDALGDRPFMLGETPSVLDPYLAMLAQWYDDETGTACLRAHRARVRGLPGIDAVWRRYFGD